MSEAAATGVSSSAGMTRVLTDERLARRAVKGDERAFAAIFDRYHQRLYRYCLAIVGDTEDAQDALQNTMVKVLRALPGEERRIELKPWLYRIAHNESIDLARRRRTGEPLEPEMTAAGPGVAREAEARERLGRLLADLEQLPERQRGALLMRELSGLGFEEIGAALGCSAAVARQTTYEARLGLRQFEAGREMDCVAVTKALSDGDGRVARRRDIRAHLRDCSSCTAFQAEIKGRTRDFAALSPLPAALAAGLLQGILGGGGGAAGGGGLAGALGAGAAKSAAGSVALKATATVAVVAALGVGAERGNLIDVGLPGGDGGGASPVPARAEAAAAPAVGAGPGNGGAAANGASTRGGGVREVTTVGGNAAVSAAARAGDDGSGVPTGEPAAGGSGNQGPHPGKPALPEAAQQGQQNAAAHKSAAHGRGAAHPEHPARPTKPPKPAKPEKSAAAKAPGGNSNGGSKGHAEPGPPAEKPAPGTGNGKKPAEAAAE